MGKGDKKTRRGKLIRGSYGVRRPHKKSEDIVINVTKSLETKPVSEPPEIMVEKSLRRGKEKQAEKPVRTKREKTV